MKKNNKIIIVIIIAVVIYFLVLFFFLGGAKKVAREKNELVLIVDQSTIWTLAKNHWTNVTLDETINELNWLKYKVYVEDEKIGNYYMWYDGNEWYLFDKDRNSINYEGELFAYNSNYDIKYTKFDDKYIEDFSYVEKVLDSKKIPFDQSKLVISSQIDIDVDNDGKKESFYAISNSTLGTNTTDNYSIVFMVKNGKIYNMFSDIRDKNQTTCLPYIYKFIDVDQDDKLELIVGCDVLRANGNKKFLYSFDNDKYEILISNR